MALAPGTRFGTYQVTAQLGAGGMGEVYRATDSSLNRAVALKVLPADVARDPDRLARFHREAELLASLNHPNVAHVYGLHTAGDTSALVMELVEGEDLSRRIARARPTTHDALRLACLIAAGLEAAHRQGIVHRDLKPANVMVRPDGQVKILDFGLAKSLGPIPSEAATATGLTMPGAVVGTPAYMSPEQARGEPVGRDADVWAFGVVLYELLTGTSPFMGPTVAETLSRVPSAPVDEGRLPGPVPAAVRRLVRRCLERDRSRRWRDLGDARIEIEEALAAPAEAGEPPPAAGGSRRVTRRQWLTRSAASAALLTAGAVGSAVAARTADGATRLYEVAGGPPADAPGLSALDIPVGWINAGLLVMRPGDPSFPLGQIDRVDVRTGAREAWRNILPRERAGVMAFMSFGVTPDGESRAYSWHRALSSLYLAEGLA